jgi:hypothetical protein
MADTKAKPEAAPVAKERKKPVRKAPVQKDYPNKLAWLAALVEYETAATESTNKAKIERLDKRIAAKKAEIDSLEGTIISLEHERAKLLGADEELVDGLTDDEHLALEGKA